MSDEAERWKEKYLKSIEHQEKLQRRWDARLDLLRRGLVRSTLAAEGTDRTVDQCMAQMRDVVRSDDMDAGLAALLPRLEKAVLDSEQRRETRVNQTSAALTALVNQLQKLPLPREVSRPLKHFAKELEGRVSQAREMPLLLSELSNLQSQALSQLEHPEEPERSGLLQRLFGSRDTEEPLIEVDTAKIATAPARPVEEAWARSTKIPQGAHNVAFAVAAATEPVESALRTAQPDPVISVPARPEPEAGVEPVAVDTDSTTRAQPAAAAVLSESAPAAGPPLAPIHSTIESEPARGAEPAPELQPAPEQNPPQPEEPHAPVLEAHMQLPAAAVKDTGTIAPAAQLPETLQLTAPLENILPGAQAFSAPDLAPSEQDNQYALPDSPEPSYSSVAKHIEDTLLGLLDDLALPERHRPQAEAMRERLQNGLNWYELLPILDDLATLMLAITDSGQHEFEAYLQHLNERLESFQANLQAASDGHADNQSAAREMDTQLREQVDGLQTSMQAAGNIDDLKNVLENHLEGLLGTMDEHRQQRDEREQEVASRLKGLAERVAYMEQEAVGYREHLEEQRQKALVDPLTELPNRAAWNERLEHEISRCQQQGTRLLLAILDLDHFKRINDNYGHLAGDKVLKIIASVLRKRLRDTDFIARFGGEEFVVLMPATLPAAGARLLETLRTAIEACPFHFKGEPVTITLSMGMTMLRAGEHSDLALKRADLALYRAKHAGRNRVETADL